MPAAEEHRSSRVGWLRAAVLGANDGILSTASLLVGVAAAGSSRSAVLLAGIAGGVAGALSMGAGEYVSVSSQSDAEAADLAMERRELDDDPEGELDELAAIYETRGLDPDLARRVAGELMAHDARFHSTGTVCRREMWIGTNSPSNGSTPMPYAST